MHHLSCTYHFAPKHLRYRLMAKANTQYWKLTILTETVFQWPGMGFMFLEAVNRVDTPLIVAYLIVVGFIFVVTNTIVDLIYGLVNPTVNLARMGA